MTRRSKNLNSFPRTWVFPGGQLDKEEDFLSALIREISEETGIQILNYTNFQEIKPLLIYESCYHNKTTKQTNQTLVVFYKIKINISNSEIHLNPQFEEVEAHAWVNKAILKKLSYKPLSQENCDNFEFLGNEYCYIENRFVKKVFNNNNFNNVESGEYIPYGHHLAIKFL